MNLPAGWLFVPKIKNRSKIEITQREICFCRDCTYRNTVDCSWRADQMPDDEDFCSMAERCE